MKDRNYGHQDLSFYLAINQNLSINLPNRENCHVSKSAIFGDSKKRPKRGPKKAIEAINNWMIGAGKAGYGGKK